MHGDELAVLRAYILMMDVWAAHAMAEQRLRLSCISRRVLTFVSTIRSDLMMDVWAAHAMAE